MDGVRLRAEQAFHDRQAAERGQTFSQSPHLLSVVDGDYLDHESWIRPAIEKLGPLNGVRVLDFGCGHAMASVIMARQGARVTGFDLSQGYLAEARKRAAHNGVQLGLLMADGNRLPFASSSFDRIWGNAILHHLDLTAVAAEIARCLLQLVSRYSASPGVRTGSCDWHADAWDIHRRSELSTKSRFGRRIWRFSGRDSRAWRSKATSCWQWRPGFWDVVQGLQAWIVVIDYCLVASQVCGGIVGTWF